MNSQFYFDKQKYYDTLLLDRDGVINVLRKNDYVKNYQEFEFRPEFLESIKELSNNFNIRSFATACACARELE